MGDGCVFEFAFAARNDERVNAVAGFGFVDEFAADGNGAVGGSGPASNSGVFQIIAGMAAGGSELNPAEFFVGPFGAALPGCACKVREFGKGFCLLRIFVVFAPTVLPLVGRG